MLESALQSLKHFDAFMKPLEDFRVRTFSGAIITFFCSLSICALFCYEWQSYRTVEVTQELFVDMSRYQKLTVNLNVTLPYLPCSVITLDLTDSSGLTKNGIVEGMKKVRLDSEGRLIEENVKASTREESSTTIDPKNCLSCYGAEMPELNIKCCQTCDEVRVAYRHKRWHFSPNNVDQCKNEVNKTDAEASLALFQADKSTFYRKALETNEGCRLTGHFEINKIQGSFHIAPGVPFDQNHMHGHDLENTETAKFNTKHYFSVFSFGNEYPNQINPLELKSINDFQRSQVIKEEENNINIQFGGFMDLNAIFNLLNAGGMMNEHMDSKTIVDSNAIIFNYFIKIVPTTYEYLDGSVVNNTYQYSVTKSMQLATQANRKLPGIFVSYDLSPIMIKYMERQKPFSHFLTGCCAIIGGLFTIASMLDAFAYRYYNMYKKYQLNKLT